MMSQKVISRCTLWLVICCMRSKCFMLVRLRHFALLPGEKHCGWWLGSGPGCKPGWGSGLTWLPQTVVLLQSHMKAWWRYLHSEPSTASYTPCVCVCVCCKKLTSGLMTVETTTNICFIRIAALRWNLDGLVHSGIGGRKPRGGASGGTMKWCKYLWSLCSAIIL